MTLEDFAAFPKIDAHVHYNTLSLAFAQQAQACGFHALVSLCADIPLAGWPYVEEQHRICRELQRRIPQAQIPVQFCFACSFHTDGFTETDYSDRLVAWVTAQTGSGGGACAVKFWKNIGMELLDADGSFVFIDHPKFAPLFAMMAERNIPLACHCGEPRNCWLPLCEMTVNNDAEYFASNPKYHMYLHPTFPSYEAQIAARDAVLHAHPTLRVMGAHLGSLEYSVQALARRLEAYPQLSVDFAHRMCHLQTQSIADRDGVIAFFVKFQDQLIYGTDIMFFKDDRSDEAMRLYADTVWRSDWAFLATGEEMAAPEVRGAFRGLALGRSILEKVYYKNAAAKYNIQPAAPVATAAVPS